MEDFRSSSSTLATFVVSVFVLGFAFGPLVMAPLSELYGRTIVYHLANAFFLIFTILCAISKSMTMLIVFRFFAGFSGVAVVTCGGGSISDMMIPQERGSAMAVWYVSC
jgi:MFS family permease